MHTSIGVRDPEHCAKLIADLWDGRALPCPHPIAGGWIAFAGTPGGIALEFYPLGNLLVPGARGVRVRRPKIAPRASATHVAIATQRSVQQVQAIADRAAFRCSECDRGPYRVLELWLEGRWLVEVLTPEMQHDYRASMTPDVWQAWL